MTLTARARAVARLARTAAWALAGLALPLVGAVVVPTLDPTPDA